MEFLRFGSSIPGSYWGCCACDIIQNFNVSPDEASSIQLVDGDGGLPIMDGRGFVFAGPTYRDIFWQRLRFGTFEKRDMPNHAFIAIITENQLSQDNTREWLAILKSAGFEFLRSVSNSVYAGQSLLGEEDDDYEEEGVNHIFGLFRNIGNGAITDPFTPPSAWTDLPSVVPEAWEDLAKMGEARLRVNLKGLVKDQRDAQLQIWNSHPPKPLLTEEEVVAVGAPVIYAGMRSEYPQESKASRDSKIAAKRKVESKPSITDPFVPKSVVTGG
jgi:hypothetical protein